MNARDLLNQWQRGLHMFHKAHEQAATLFERRGRLLGSATVIVTTAVGTGIFADAPALVGDTAWKIGGGLLSLFAAVLSALQGSLKYAELAAAHRRAARSIGPLRRETEQMLAESDAGESPKPEALTALRKKWAEIDQHAPTIPQPLWDRIAAGIPAPNAAAKSGG